MSEGELVRLVKARQLPGDPVLIEASEAERVALARRFGLPRLHALRAQLSLEQDGAAVRAKGSMRASFLQTCTVSGEEFSVKVDENIALKFVDAATTQAALADATEELEIELAADECDEIEYSGGAFDLGEAVAQSLGLAIDPYAEGPNAEATRKKAGIAQEGEQDGPMAEMLKGLKKG